MDSHENTEEWSFLSYEEVKHVPPPCSLHSFVTEWLSTISSTDSFELSSHTSIMPSSPSEKLSPLNPNRLKANPSLSESSRGSTHGGRLHLAENNIFLLFSTDPVPSFVTALISRIQCDRDERRNALPDQRAMELLEMGRSQTWSPCFIVTCSRPEE